MEKEGRTEIKEARRIGGHAQCGIFVRSGSSIVCRRCEGLYASKCVRYILDEGYEVCVHDAQSLELHLQQRHACFLVVVCRVTSFLVGLDVSERVSE